MTLSLFWKPAIWKEFAGIFWSYKDEYKFGRREYRNKQGSGQVNVNEINIWGNLSVTEEQSFMEKNHLDGNSFGLGVDI